MPLGIDEVLGIPPTVRRSTASIGALYVVEVASIVGGSFFKYWNARNESHFKERFTWFPFISHGGYMVFNIIVYDTYSMLSGSQILYTHPRSIVFCFAG